MASKPEYKTFPIYSTEEIQYSKDFGKKKAGDKEVVHPNTAILMRFIGVVEGSEVKKAKEPKKETPKAKKPRAKKNTSK